MSFCINGCKNRVLTAINYYPCNGASRQIDFIVLPFPELNFLNPKSQNSNLKQISKYNESNSKRVWIIGDWNLGIVCYLLFGAWNFFNSRTQLYLHIQYDFFNIFVGHDTRCILRPGPVLNVPGNVGHVGIDLISLQIALFAVHERVGKYRREGYFIV